MSEPTLSPEYAAEDSKGQSLATMTALLVLTTFFVILRCGVRMHRKAGFGLDEWLMLTSLLFTWGLYAVCILDYKFGGYGKHIAILDETNPQAILNMEIYFFAADYLYATALATAKWSIIAMYSRVFPTRFIRLSSAILAFVVGAWYLGCIFITTFECHPVRKAWDPLVSGTCLDHSKVFIGKAVPSFSTDFLILLLPIVEVSKLHVRMSQRFGIGAIFLLGGLACASSVARFKVIMGLTESDADATYILPNIMVWTIVEPCTAIISGCLPLLRPVLTALMDHSGFTRLISTKERKQPQFPDLVTFGRSGGKDRANNKAAALTGSDTSVERLRGEPEPLRRDTVSLHHNGNDSTWRTDSERGWGTTEQDGPLNVSMHTIDVQTDMRA